MQRYMKPLLERIQNGEIDPSFVITHRMRLDDAPRGYDMFMNKEDDCEKVVLYGVAANLRATARCTFHPVLDFGDLDPQRAGRDPRPMAPDGAIRGPRRECSSTWTT